MRAEPGNCYENAGQEFLFGEFKGDADARLVHGFPTLQCAPWSRYGHAWVETTSVVGLLDGHEMRLTMCHDPSTGVVMPRELYYALGRIDADLCAYYAHDDARRLAVETRVWGNWNDRCPSDAVFDTGKPAPKRHRRRAP